MSQVEQQNESNFNPSEQDEENYKHHLNDNFKYFDLSMTDNDLLDDINRQTGRLWYFRPYDSDVEPLEAATLRPRQHPPGTPPLRREQRLTDLQSNSTHACTLSR